MSTAPSRPKKPAPQPSESSGQRDPVPPGTAEISPPKLNLQKLRERVEAQRPDRKKP